MAITVTRDISATPGAVLAAIRDGGREWRASVIPDAVRSRGVVRVDARLDGAAAFRLAYVRGFGWDGEGDMLELRGEVAPRTGGGSRVTARCGRRGGLVPAVIVFGALAAWSWVSSGHGSVALLVLTALGVGVTLLVDRRVALHTDAEARYLVERLEETLARVERETVASSAVQQSR